MEIIFEVIFETIGHVLFEGIFEVIARTWPWARSDKPHHPLFSLFGYVFFAAMLAYISVLLFPAHIIRAEHLRIANLLIAPVIVGLLMKRKRRILEMKNARTIPLDSFWFGFAYAFVFALVRFYLAR